MLQCKDARISREFLCFRVPVFVSLGSARDSIASEETAASAACRQPSSFGRMLAFVKRANSVLNLLGSLIETA